MLLLPSFFFLLLPSFFLQSRSCNCPVPSVTSRRCLRLVVQVCHSRRVRSCLLRVYRDIPSFKQLAYQQTYPVQFHNIYTLYTPGIKQTTPRRDIMQFLAVFTTLLATASMAVAMPNVQMACKTVRCRPFSLAPFIHRVFDRDSGVNLELGDTSQECTWQSSNR